MLREPEPVLVVELYPGERRALLEVLQGLEPDAWQLPTGGGTSWVQLLIAQFTDIMVIVLVVGAIAWENLLPAIRWIL